MTDEPNGGGKGISVSFPANSSDGDDELLLSVELIDDDIENGEFELVIRGLDSTDFEALVGSGIAESYREFVVARRASNLEPLRQSQVKAHRRFGLIR